MKARTPAPSPSHPTPSPTPRATPEPSPKEGALSLYAPGLNAKRHAPPLTAAAVLQLQRTIGNRATTRLLQARSGTTTPSVIQRVDPETYEKLLIDDASQNQSSQQTTAYEALCSTLKSKFGEDADECLALLQPIVAFYPIDFKTLKTECKREAVQRCFFLIKTEVGKAEEKVNPVLQAVNKFGSKESPENLLRTYGFAQLSQSVKAYEGVHEKSNETPSMENANIPLKKSPTLIFDDFIRQATLATIPTISLDQLPPTEPPNYQKADSKISDVVLDSAKSTATHKPPMEPNAYIHRHFTPATMEFLLANPDVDICVLEGTANDLLRYAKAQGYSALNRLTDNPVTDFVKYTARNEKGVTTLFVLAASGDSYRREILAHFTHYQDPQKAKRIIHPNRIHLLQLGENTAVEEFKGFIEQSELFKIDVVALGKVDNLRQELAGMYNLYPIRIIRTTYPPMFGWLYEINGLRVLSLKIEPGLYAGRAGLFMQALREMGSNPRNLVFVGTSGAIDQNLRKGDVVAPSLFSQVDGLKPTYETAIKNQAKDPSLKTQSPLPNLLGASDNNNLLPLLDSNPFEEKSLIRDEEESNQSNQNLTSSMESGNDSESQRPARFISGGSISHGAVDSILLEDDAWFKQRQKEGITVVEQEVGGVLQTLGKDVQGMKLFIYLTVSDVLGQTTFDESDSDQTEQAIDSFGALMVQGIAASTGTITPAPEVNSGRGFLQLKIPTGKLEDHYKSLNKNYIAAQKTLESIPKRKQGVEMGLKRAMEEEAKAAKKSQEESQQTSVPDIHPNKPMEPQAATESRVEKQQKLLQALEQEEIQSKAIQKKLKPLVEKLPVLLRVRDTLMQELERLFEQANRLHPHQSEVMKTDLYNAIIMDPAFNELTQPIMEDDDNNNNYYAKGGLSLEKDDDLRGKMPKEKNSPSQLPFGEKQKAPEKKEKLFGMEAQNFGVKEQFLDMEAQEFGIKPEKEQKPRKPKQQSLAMSKPSASTSKKEQEESLISSSSATKQPELPLKIMPEKSSSRRNNNNKKPLEDKDVSKKGTGGIPKPPIITSTKQTEQKEKPKPVIPLNEEQSNLEKEVKARVLMVVAKQLHQYGTLVQTLLTSELPFK